jgi:hypothetical protein
VLSLHQGLCLSDFEQTQSLPVRDYGIPPLLGGSFLFRRAGRLAIGPVLVVLGGERNCLVTGIVMDSPSPAQQFISHCRDKVVMEAKSEVLDRVLSELPGLKQSNPVENTEFIRFTVRLKIDPLDNPRQPEIFILFTHHDLEQARGTHDGLELAFRRNIRQHSFKDEINGKTVETSIQKDSSYLASINS